ncbi:MAG: hypothetical protein O4753_15160, partial [Trichodesmium sp. St7_bin2_1]|nr:hypothetical protein [Trichodesmium sp. St7_bin2_1]
AGVGNFNDDGVSDILCHNENNGGTRVWLMNDGGTRDSIVDPGAFPVPWDVAGVANFNDDGVADILWHNEDNGATRVWLMNDDGTRDSIVNPVPVTWDIVGM